MLRKLVLAALAVLVIVPVAAFAADTHATPKRFGTAVTVKKPVSVAQLAGAPEKFKGRTIRLEGTVKNVCQGKGCWVEVADSKGTSFMARSLDESVLLPKDCKGMHVVVEGKVTTLPAAVRNEAEPTDHACPKPEWVVSTQGVELTPAPAAPAAPATSR
jgi:hypothetical protein